MLSAAFIRIVFNAFEQFGRAPIAYFARRPFRLGVNFKVTRIEEDRDRLRREIIYATLR